MQRQHMDMMVAARARIRAGARVCERDRRLGNADAGWLSAALEETGSLEQLDLSRE
jgi:hypothetical protein